MSAPKALVVRAAGTNCEHETVRALELVGAEAELIHVRALLAEPGRLDDAQIIVVPGGFSYGDDVSAGRVLGLELRGALQTELTNFVERGGFALGVCNGFQVLLETGLFQPGEERSLALYANASNHYECRWVWLEAQECACPWIRPGWRFPVPVAHAEGRFCVQDPELIEKLEAGGQVAFRYVPAEGEPGPVPHDYPINPNGSVGDIAGICDPTGRVVGLMPHPERNLDPWNHPSWTRLAPRSEGEGVEFYRAMVEAAAGALV